jgi:hypothetical protein
MTANDDTVVCTSLIVMAHYPCGIDVPNPT